METPEPSPQQRIKAARMDLDLANAILDMTLSGISVTFRNGWLVLKVIGDGEISFPLYGGNTDEKIDKFAGELKKAVKGVRIAPLD